MTLSFSEVEIKEAVWDCDNFKSLGPNGINLGSIKDLWDILKDELMHFFSKFHHNVKFAKGINSNFIALIPKG